MMIKKYLNTLKLISALTLPSITLSLSSHAEIVADYNADFSAKTPMAGWAYQWNPEGVEVGEHAAYADLVDPGGNWQLVADKSHKPLDKTSTFPNAQWLVATNTSMAPGDPAFRSTDQLDHYVICAYTIQPGEAGDGSIVNSRIKREQAFASSEIRIYVNDQLLGSDILEGDTPSAFNVSLGQLNVGDTIYFALGPNNKSSIKSMIQFQIDTK